MTAHLILENGMTFTGEFFGAVGEAIGEVVFATGMTGYLETLTDPSYHGQIILQTFPLIGNYGVIPADFESARVAATAYIVKQPCENPSNFRSEYNLDTFLKERGIVGLCGIDTRALARVIRGEGVMNGKITTAPPTETDIAAVKAHTIKNAVAVVSRRDILREEAMTTEDETSTGTTPDRRIALIDFGAKRGIAHALLERGCAVWSFPHDTPPEDILKIKPFGILLTNGPADPADPANENIIKNIRALQQTGIPLFGICLGHQLLAMANGYKTRKLKFGHRGHNQPVRDVASGRVYITSQNHGYTVVADESAFINVNDFSCEGLDYGRSFSVQFHPEAKGGPLDTAFLFDEFLRRCDAYAAG